MHRFETLKEPAGTYSIFDASTELPVTIEDKTSIGLCRHEVRLALLAAIEIVRTGNGPLLASLSALNGRLTGEDHQRFQMNCMREPATKNHTVGEIMPCHRTRQ